MVPKKYTPNMLKRLRKRVGFTQQELAELLGVVPNTIWRWESGRSPIDQFKLSYYTGYLNGLIRENEKKSVKGAA